jgi:hypothetical protein
VIELAKNCPRTSASKKISKIQAAQHQLEGAIANLFLGNWSAAITLAGAAEDILPNHQDYGDLFTVAKTNGPARHGRSEKEIAELLNEVRNWLKHHQMGSKEFKADIEVTQIDAVVMVLRAYTRFCAHHAPIEKNEILSEHLGIFENWFRENYADWLVPRISDNE